MRLLWDLLLIISVMVWVLSLAQRGMISPSHTAIVLIGLVSFIALIRIGGGVGRIIRTTFRVGLPLASLLTFAVVYGYDVKGVINILLQLSPLVVVLLGLYLMFGGLFTKKR